MNGHPAEILKRSMLYLLPGLAIGVAGSLALLGIGVLILTEGVPLVRWLTADLPQPWRSLTLLVSLGGALIAVGHAGRAIMGCIISCIRHKGEV
jgi:hypothetical protein